MNAFHSVLVCGTFALATVHCTSADETPKKGAFTLYDGFEDDQAALRTTVRLKVTSALTDTVNASSPKACEAARRVFGRVSFLFKKRDDILKLLGDPETISDYNERAKADPNAPLVYVFDIGFGGWRYTLKFSNGECFGVEVDGLN